MEVLLFGTSDYAVLALNELLAAPGIDVKAAITQPDRRKGRGRRLCPSPLKAAAELAGVPVFSPPDVNEASGVTTVRTLSGDLGVVVGYGQKIGAELLSAFKFGLINVHPSLLPKYRGAAPVVSALLDGVAITGVSVIALVARMDAGDILAQSATELREDETAGELRSRLFRLGASMLPAVIEAIERGDCPRRPQDDSEATYTRRLTKQDGQIQWGADAASICRFVRAMSPWPGAFTSWRQPGGEPKKFTVTKAHVVSTDEEAGAPPGTVVEVGESIQVLAARGRVAITELHPAGSRVMGAPSFLRGCAMDQGAALGPA